jgi:hypothetical protein
MDTILFLETIVHFPSYERYKVSHTGRKHHDTEYLIFLSRMYIPRRVTLVYSRSTRSTSSDPASSKTCPPPSPSSSISPQTLQVSVSPVAALWARVHVQLLVL